MKVFVTILSAIVLLSSCQKLKEISKNRSRVVEHHYHDSTFNNFKETIYERRIPGDSTKAWFNLAELLKSGYGKSTDRYFTTEVRYVNDGISVTTNIDSLEARIRTLERNIGSVQVESNTEKVINEQTKEVTTNSYTWILAVVITVVVMILLRIGWNRLKQWNPIGLK